MARLDTFNNYTSINCIIAHKIANQPNVVKM